ncbi:hypothetical protein ACIBSV_02210 [Embleya sp. NPDC050154]|uniref:hypothetical protein n=1 Tax=Embleya sp. NPDC050154 TaxID=3363988 RepID=UPI003797851B
MTRPERDWKLLRFEYDPDLLKAQYELPTGEYRWQTFAVPSGTLPALVGALLAHADQNERTDILRAEVERNDEAMSARYRAMTDRTRAPSWLPEFLRHGNTLR